MLNTLLIFIGAGLGGVTRFWVSTLTYSLLGRAFPYGTLVVNVSGCFFIGFISILLLDTFDSISPALRALLLIGFLGGYTTFSSFSIETLTLFEMGANLNGILNILLSVTLCLMATWLGMMGARQL